MSGKPGGEGDHSTWVVEECETSEAFLLGNTDRLVPGKGVVLSESSRGAENSWWEEKWESRYLCVVRAFSGGVR